MSRSELRPHLALILAMVLWGSSFVALKQAVTEMAPLLVIFLRMCIGSIGFVAVWPWIRSGFRYQAGDWKYLCAMALCEPCFYFVFEANGLSYTSAGQAGMITAILPLMVAGASRFFLNEHNALRQWLGFAIAVAGVITLTAFSVPDQQAPNPLLGNILQVMAMICAVGYTMLVKVLIPRYSASVLTAIQCFIGLLFFLPVAAVADWPPQISWQLAGIIVYLGIVITLGTYGLYNYSLAHLKASVAAGYTNLLPVFALLFSMWLLHERINLYQWLAIGVIFLGVFLSQYRAEVAAPKLPPVTG